ncbi:hypothetical protein KA093_00175 [Candidatus Saccharibacteria bacterium]|nr:hypothetical protein [Candidatus Saccharibacteria bacterium]
MYELWAHESAYKMLPADKVAELIVNGIEANKLYVYTGTDSRPSSPHASSHCK